MTKGRPPGAKNKPLLPGVTKPPQKKYVSLIRKPRVVKEKVSTSINLRNMSIEEIKQIAINAHTTTTVGSFLQWLSTYNDTDGNTFQLTTISRFHRAFRCNRGTPEEHTEKPKPGTIGRNTNCPAILKVWAFGADLQNVSTALYVVREGTHNHESCHRFTRMSQHTRYAMALDLAKGVDVTHLLQEQARGCGMDAQSPAASLATLANKTLPRSLRLNRPELYRIKNGLAKRRYQLHWDQDKSVQLWCRDVLKERLLYLQNSVQTSFGVETTPFQLAFQTWLSIALMRGTAKNHPASYLINSLVSIDATHNLTKNRKILLYTIVAWTREGHACPIAYLFTTDKSEEVVYQWLSALRLKFPLWNPAKVMTDCDIAQINAIRRVFAVPYELCSWHVLRNWRKKSGATKVANDVNGIVSTTYIDHYLYVHMSRLMKQKEYSTFERDLQNLTQHLNTISLTAPVEKDRDVARYFLDHYILPSSTWNPRSWAHAYRDVSVTATHTTMLLEAWHHVLKYTLLRRRSNHRVDYLLSVLTTEVQMYYSDKLWIEFNGGERGGRLTKKSKAQGHAQRALHLISGQSITWISTSQCIIPSQQPSKSHITYTVSIVPGAGANLSGCYCDCPFFRYNRSAGLQCKHIYAAIRSLAEGDNGFVPVASGAAVIVEDNDTIDVAPPVPGSNVGISTNLDEDESDKEQEAPENRFWEPVQSFDPILAKEEDSQVVVHLVGAEGLNLTTPDTMFAPGTPTRPVSRVDNNSSDAASFADVPIPESFESTGRFSSFSPLNVKNNSFKRPSKTYQTMGRTRKSPSAVDLCAGHGLD